LYISNGQPDASNVAAFSAISMTYSGQYQVVSTLGGAVFTSTDYGVTFYRVPSMYDSTYNIWTSCAVDTGGNIMCAIEKNSGKVYVTKNGQAAFGASAWGPIPNFPSEGITSFQDNANVGSAIDSIGNLWVCAAGHPVDGPKPGRVFSARIL
jgi:photosystem II stability/assembly factor-like uncharacterized protein